MTLIITKTLLLLPDPFDKASYTKSRACLQFAE